MRGFHLCASKSEHYGSLCGIAQFRSANDFAGGAGWCRKVNGVRRKKAIHRGRRATVIRSGGKRKSFHRRLTNATGRTKWIFGRVRLPWSANRNCPAPATTQSPAQYGLGRPPRCRTRSECWQTETGSLTRGNCAHNHSYGLETATRWRAIFSMRLDGRRAFSVSWLLTLRRVPQPCATEKHIVWGLLVSGQALYSVLEFLL